MREIRAEIRPGVFRPDWSSVTSPVARQALNGRMAARAGLMEKWSQALEADQDLVWRTILRLYADAGRPPFFTEVARETAFPQERVSMLLNQLQHRDLLGLEPGTGAIRYAYPFTQAHTGHCVEVGGRALRALCAIDALGVGALYRIDVSVNSTCRACSEPIHVMTAGEGRAVRSATPESVVVWYDFAYDGSAATSCCPTIAFFCSDDNLRRWLGENKQRRQGMMLTVNDALEVGRAVFGPVLLQSPRV